MNRLEAFQTVLLLALSAAVVALALRQPAAPHKMGAVNGPSSWNVANWYVDPANASTHASDSNDCQTSSTPCASFGQIVSRWGTKLPTLAQVTTIQWLSDAASTDPVDIVPTIVGGGGLVLKGTLVSQIAPTIGTFTAKNRSAGTKATITASGQSGTYWSTACGGTCVGMDVHDTTANAQFWIDSDNGSATASITEPFALPVSEIPTRQTIASGDSLVVYRPSVVYFTQVDSTALGTGAGGGVMITQMTTNADYEFFAGGQTGFVEVSDKAAAVEVERSALSNPFLTSFYVFSSDNIEGNFSIFGGSCFNQQGSQLFNRSTIDCDAIVNLRPHSEGVVTVSDAYFAAGQWFTDTGGPQSWTRYLVDASNCGVAAVWGPATINVTSGEQLAVRGGATAAGSLLATGGLTLGAGLGATGFTFNNTTGVFSAGATALTPANVDTNGSYMDPRVGSRIYVTP
jgi:hypothetical protein